MKESNILKKIMVKASQHGLRLFRNNTGTGWTGKRVTVDNPQWLHAQPGDVLLRKARPLRAGLCEGSSDLIGWESVTITQDMVGTKVALFVGWEVKTTNGRATALQENFLDKIKSDGGKGILTFGEEQADEVFENLDD